MWFLVILLGSLVVCAIVIFFRSHASDIPLLVNTTPPVPDVIPVHPLVDPPSNPITAPIENASLPINQIRIALGNPPRKFSKAMQKYLRCDPPDWIPSETMRPKNSQLQDRVRANGKVVWSALVQANNNLFSPGPDDHPALVAWSEDPFFDNHVDELQQIAQACFALKGIDQTEPDAQQLSQAVTSEMSRPLRMSIPTSITHGREVFVSVLLVVRRHLPAGHLTETIMPVWIDPEPTGIVILVPAGYWPASLMEAWKS